MDLPTVLRRELRDLLDLGASIDDEDDLGGRLTALVSALRAAVPSYRGLSLTVHVNERPVNLTSFLPVEDEEIATSLRLPISVLAPGFDTRSRVIFYAATPGAFVDLAAEVGHAVRTPSSPAQRSPDRAVSSDGGVSGCGGRHERQHCDRDGDCDGVMVLDADLPPHTLVSRLSGVDEASTVNRAIGMLIEQGHHPDDAHATLRRHAAAAGVDTHTYAARLLRR